MARSSVWLPAEIGWGGWLLVDNRRPQLSLRATPPTTSLGTGRRPADATQGDFASIVILAYAGSIKAAETTGFRTP